MKAGKRPNPETISAMKEAEHIAHDPNAKGYSSLAALFADLRSGVPTVRAKVPDKILHDIIKAEFVIFLILELEYVFVYTFVHLR